MIVWAMVVIFVVGFISGMILMAVLNVASREDSSLKWTEKEKIFYGNI